MILTKEADTTTTTMTTEISKCYRHSTLFDTQNAGNRIFELLDFKFFLGQMAQTSLGGKGRYGPFSGHYTFTGRL